MACQKSHHLPCDYSLFLPALILTTAVLSCLPGAPSAPGCLAASGRQARLQAGSWGARRIRKKSYAKVFRASVRAETSRLPVCGSAARRNRRLG
ncbi:hypothetical protein [Escherichia coli]|uniref:hypothetical protein n=1 Tax=Escherichia coli TaxID=562 RepID=UPI00388F4998